MWAYKLYYTFLGIATLLIAYFSVKRITKDRFSACCFAILYTFSSYRFADVFYRGALGECIALAFLPLACLGIYLIFRDNYKNWGVLSIAMALMAYSHLLSLLMTSAFVVVCAIALWVKADNKKQRISAFIKAVLVSAVLSLGALVPIIQAVLTNRIYHPDGTVEKLTSEADGLPDIIINSVFSKPTTHGIGLLILIVLAIDIILVWRVKDREKRFIALSLTVLSLLLFILTSSVAPWKIIARLPVVRLIQFPWRLNAYVALLFCLAFAIILHDVIGKKRAVKYLLLTGIVICAVGLNLLLMLQLHNTEAFRIKGDYIDSMQYEHPDYTSDLFSQGFQDGSYRYYLNNTAITPNVVISENGSSMRIDLENVEKESVLEVPISWFSTTKAKVNGETVEAVMSERGTVQIRMVSDGTASVEIYNEYPPLVYASWIISFAALAVCLGMAVRGRHKALSGLIPSE